VVKRFLIYLGIPGAIVASLVALTALTDMAPWASKTTVAQLAQLSLYDVLAGKEERVSQLLQMRQTPFVLNEVAKLCTEIAKIRTYLGEPESWVCR